MQFSKQNILSISTGCCAKQAGSPGELNQIQWFSKHKSNTEASFSKRPGRAPAEDQRCCRNKTKQTVKGSRKQGHRENVDAPGQKRKMKPTTSEAAENFQSLEINYGKLLVVEFMTQTLKHCVL